MIQYKGKDLEQLTLEETIEFEKQMLKKVLSASKAQMSGPIIAVSYTHLTLPTILLV